MKRVGVLVGREWSFPPRFIDEVNGRNAGVVAEFAKLGGTRMDERVPYSMLVDRISHEVPYYRSYLKHAVLEGVIVVNNPFMWSADDKFFGASLCTKLGIAHPKTIALPNKDYVPSVVRTESLRNLEYPLNWQAVVDYVGLPCILKDAHGSGRGINVCHNINELIRYYDNSALLTMILQEFIKWDQYIRCICIGREVVLPMPYDTHNRKYLTDEKYLTPELWKRVIDDSLKLVNALGYDMNMVEWAIKDGVPYAIDFMNPVPDMDVNSLMPEYFEWVVKHTADFVIDRAHNPQPQLNELRWAKLFAVRE